MRKGTTTSEAPAHRQMMDVCKHESRLLEGSGLTVLENLGILCLTAVSCIELCVSTAKKEQ